MQTFDFVMWTVVSFEELDAELGLLIALCLGATASATSPLDRAALAGITNRVRGLAGARERTFRSSELTGLFADLSPDQLAHLAERCSAARQRVAEAVRSAGGVKHVAAIVVRRTAAQRLASIVEEGFIELMVLRSGDIPCLRF